MFNAKPWLEVPSRGIAVVDLSCIEPVYLRRIAVHAALYTLLKQAKKNRKRITVVIDEAHNVLDNDRRNIVVEAFLEYRKFGIEIVLATSNFIDIPKQIVENTSTLIIHRIPSLEQADTLADLFGTSYREKESWIETLRTLRIGIATTITRYSSHPQLVEI